MTHDSWPHLRSSPYFGEAGLFHCVLNGPCQVRTWRSIITAYCRHRSATVAYRVEIKATYALRFADYHRIDRDNGRLRSTTSVSPTEKNAVVLTSMLAYFFPTKALTPLARRNKRASADRTWQLYTAMHFFSWGRGIPASRHSDHSLAAIFARANLTLVSRPEELDIRPQSCCRGLALRLPCERLWQRRHRWHGCASSRTSNQADPPSFGRQDIPSSFVAVSPPRSTER